ncbi:MAG TPA: DUF2283 domain-containing protein [Anaerolineae bacterium]|nr:DUF2283 domain-containing protein [Anaerolineae bacterium]
MSVIYDPETDTLTIIFSDAQVADSDEVREGTILDFDANGNVVSMEILKASQHVKTPSQIDYRVAPVPV